MYENTSVNQGMCVIKLNDTIANAMHMQKGVRIRISRGVRWESAIRRKIVFHMDRKSEGHVPKRSNPFFKLFSLSQAHE